MNIFKKIFIGGIFFISCALSFESKVSARDAEGNIVVVVDPGHGGYDGGAASSLDNESALNWNIAVALKAELETYNGVKVYLTRGSAEWNSNAARGRMGAQIGADLFVSCHNNSAEGDYANGVAVYGTVNPNFKDAMQSLANIVAGKVSALGLANGGYQFRASESRPGRDYYTMLDESADCGIPGIIIEHCYLSNPSDASFIHDPLNQSRCGVADATGIAEYFGLTKRGVAADEKLTLVRGYSAYMMSEAPVSYTSSDNSVAYVSENGVITAVSQGSATISCTKADGNTETVTIEVPAVGQIGIFAGINPTFYNASDVAAFNKEKVIVKALYTDGHAEQISSGITVGDLPAGNNDAYDVAVSAGGYNCTLRIYGSGAAGSYSENNNMVIGTNSDILVYPPVYNGINTGITIKNEGGMSANVPSAGEAQTETPTEMPTEAPTEEVTEAPTEAPTEEVTEIPTEEVTESPTETTESVTEETPEEETDSETTAEEVTETPTKSEEMTTAMVEKTSDNETTADTKAQKKTPVWAWVIAGVVIAIGIILTVVLAVKRKKIK